MIALHRRLAVLGRALLIASRFRPVWALGMSALSAAKILENMEIGHNVLHGQWDWMNDPQIHSSTWDWDTASTAEAWKHSHNYIHHTYTNIRGKDRDLGYEIMRIDPYQKWHPVYLAQPVYNVLLAFLFEWGVAVHDLDFDAIRRGEKPKEQVLKELKGIAGKARAQIVKDYVAWPLVSALVAGGASLAAESLRATRRRTRARKALGAGQAPAAPTAQGRGARHRAGRVAARRDDLPRDPGREPDRQRGPQRVVLRDHLLRPLPRPDLHVQPGRGDRREPRSVVRAPARGRGQHRGRRVLPRRQRQPRLPGRAPPVPGHAELALRGGCAAGQGDLRALRAAVQHRPVLAAAGDGAAHDPAPGLPGRLAAAQAGPVPGGDDDASASAAEHNGRPVGVGAEA